MLSSNVKGVCAEVVGGAYVNPQVYVNAHLSAFERVNSPQTEFNHEFINFGVIQTFSSCFVTESQLHLVYFLYCADKRVFKNAVWDGLREETVRTWGDVLRNNRAISWQNKAAVWRHSWPWSVWSASDWWVREAVSETSFLSLHICSFYVLFCVFHAAFLVT